MCIQFFQGPRALLSARHRRYAELGIPGIVRVFGPNCYRCVFSQEPDTCHEWFAVDNWGVVPDMIATVQGITSGYLPLGAVIVSEQIAGYCEDHTFWGELTYSGHPMSCAAGIAALQVYQQHGLLENTRRMGAVMAEGLAVNDSALEIADAR